MPVLVLPRLFAAFSAAGVSTALSCDVGAGETEEASGSLLVALLTAFPALGPEEPAVPLMACPVERVLPSSEARGCSSTRRAASARSGGSLCLDEREVPPNKYAHDDQDALHDPVLCVNGLNELVRPMVPMSG